MDNLISAVLENYIPTIVIVSFIVGIFVIAIAGVIRNSGKHDDIIRSNLIIKTVVVGLIMLFLSGVFVFAFHQTYVSKYYGDIKEGLVAKLPQNLSDAEIKQAGLSLGNEINTTKSNVTDPKCVLIVVDTIDCVKKTISDVLKVFFEKIVRGLGETIITVLKAFNFNFLFNLPAELFSSDPNLPAEQLAKIVNFNNLIRLSEIIGLAWVYLLVVTHYFKSIIFSLDNDYSADFIGDMGKMILGFMSVFLARYVAEAIVVTAQSFANFLFSTQLATGLSSTLAILTTDSLWNIFSGFWVSLIVLVIIALAYIILFGFLIFKNAKRYFILLIMIFLAPIFTPMLFFDMTRSMGLMFWNKFITTSFSLMFDLLILLFIFIFLGAGGLSLGNLILMLVGLAIVVDSNNLIQQIANASEVAGFRSVVRNSLKTGSGWYYKLKNFRQ